MKFKIEGVSAEGAPKHGTIIADDEADALRKAKDAGIYVSKISPVADVKGPVKFRESKEPPSYSPSVGFVISSGPIAQQYEVLGMVVGFVSQTEGCNGGIAVENVYKAALQRLVESAQALQANGLMHVNFQNRVASGIGCNQNKQVFEVFAWGTAIRF